MKHVFRLCPFEVMTESGESSVRIIFPVMNQQRRIVSHEYIHRLKVLQVSFNLGFVEQVIASRFEFQ